MRCSVRQARCATLYIARFEGGVRPLNLDARCMGTDLRVVSLMGVMVLILFTTSCASLHTTNEPRLTKAQVTAIASEALRKQHIQMTEFAPSEPEYHADKHVWWVMFWFTGNI